MDAPTATTACTRVVYVWLQRRSHCMHGSRCRVWCWAFVWVWVCGGGGAGISAVEPAQYCRRFVRWIRHEVIDGDDFTRLGLGMEEEDEEGHRDSPGPTSLRTSSDASALSSVGSVGGGRSASRSQQRGRVDMAVMHEEQDTDLESSGSSGDDDGDSGGGGGDGGGGDARSS